MSLQELADSIMIMDHRLISMPKRELEWCRIFVVKKLKEAYDFGLESAKNAAAAGNVLPRGEED